MWFPSSALYSKPRWPLVSFPECLGGRGMGCPVCPGVGPSPSAPGSWEGSLWGLLRRLLESHLPRVGSLRAGGWGRATVTVSACSYVWEHLDVGYVQGMCDLLAPLLVILDNDQLAYSCFSHLMKRMSQNFPHGGAMDTHFANMRSLIQILDSELFELMHQNGDYTHFYFCYRWFLLDFKRELLYEDVFAVWEVIWAARHISSEHFVLFIALALVEAYREIIRDNNMDFTDIIKFFNEWAERHDAQEILRIARDLVHKVQMLIENK